MSHLGPRVSALLDGQLSAVESERAWQHVQGCHQCRDLVEREGWVKTRLAGWSMLDPHRGSASDGLKAGLKADPFGLPPGELYLTMGATRPPQPRRGRRAVGLVALGGGAAGAAVMGVLALGTAPADVPGIERRPPVTQILTPSPVASRLPTSAPR